MTREELLAKRLDVSVGAPLNARGVYELLNAIAEGVASMLPTANQRAIDEAIERSRLLMDDAIAKGEFRPHG